jgi:hypothetical protein
MMHDTKATEPFLDIVRVSDDVQPSSKDKGHSPRNAWRFIVSLGATTAVFVLLVNVAVLVWVLLSFERAEGLANVYQGIYMVPDDVVVPLLTFIQAHARQVELPRLSLICSSTS